MGDGITLIDLWEVASHKTVSGVNRKPGNKRCLELSSLFFRSSFFFVASCCGRVDLWSVLTHHHWLAWTLHHRFLKMANMTLLLDAIKRDGVPVVGITKERTLRRIAPPPPPKRRNERI